MFLHVKNLMLAGAVALAAVACTQEKKTGYTIQGEIADMTTGTVYLKCYQDGAFVDVDSAAIENGKFTFEGTVTEPMAYGLTTVKENRRPLVFFLGNEQIQAKMDEVNKKLDLTGATVNEVYVQNEKLVGEEGYNIDSLVAAHPASPVSAYLFMRNFATRMDYDGVKAIRDKFDASLDTTVYVKQIEDLLGRLVNLRVGATAPDFTLNDPDGKPVSLSSLRGKYVLVDFWASWCPDCRKENPNIVAAYKKYQNKNFTVLGVSLDRKKEPWVAAIEKDGLTWTHVSDLQGWDTPVADLYVIKWIPKNYLIDPEGVILASGLEGEALDTKLAEVLK